MRVMHVLQSLQLGGAESIAIALANWTSSQGHHAAICASSGQLDHRVDSSVSRYEPGGDDLLRQASGIYQAARSFRPDILHAHQRRESTICLAVGRRLGIPVVEHAHCELPDRRGRLVSFRSRHVFAVSEGVRNMVIEDFGRPPERVSLVDNVPVAVLGAQSHPTRVNAGATDSLRLLGVGRVDVQKDPARFIRVVEAINNMTPARGTWLGVGPLLAEARRAAESSNIIDFPGKSDDITCHLQSADGLVITSAWEGLPLVALEALALGVPVIATAVGGLPQLLGDAQCGTLVAPNASDDEFAQAVIAGTGGSRDVLEMTERGRELIQTRFNPDVAFQPVISEYERTLGPRSGSPPVLVDGRTAQGSRTGVGHYTVSLIRHWPSDRGTCLVLGDSDRDSLEVGQEATSWPGGLLWHIRAIALALRSGSEYFSPESLIVPCVLGRRSTVTIHDITPVLIPDRHTRRNVLIHRLLLRATMKRVASIIVPTHAVKRDLVDFMPEVSSKTEVIHEGPRSEPLTVPDDGLAKLVDQREPVVLYVGTIEPRKNVDQLIEAFRQVSDGGWTLVIAGKIGWLSEEARAAFERAIQDDRIKYLGFVSDRDLGDLYARSAVFCYVSSAEGFGLPVLEAMAYGVPVIHSDDPALCEVAGGAGICVPLASLSDDLPKALTLAMQDRALRLRLSEHSLERAREFSWSRASARTLDVIASSKRPRP